MSWSNCGIAVMVAFAFSTALAVEKSAAAQNGKIAFAEETFDAPVWPRVMTVDPLRGGPVATLDLPSWISPAPSWSPDGRRIAFARITGPGLASDIWTVSNDMRGLRQITATPNVRETEPSWSPDGRRMAYVANEGVWVLDLTTRRTARLSPPGVTDDQPTWAPDGARLAFARDRGGRDGRDIYTMRVSPGATAIRLVALPGDDTAPSWAPDGRSIAWANEGATYTQARIWVIGRDGRGARQLTHGPYPDFHPSWSPDGRSIAFQRPETRDLYPDYVWTMDRAGARQRRIVLGQQPDWGQRPRAMSCGTTPPRLRPCPRPAQASPPADPHRLGGSSS